MTDPSYGTKDVAFTKMHGLGNDFVIIDARGRSVALDPSEAAYLSDRHRGVGCDQLVVIHDDPVVDARVEIFNSDGSLSFICGNAFRCVASMLWSERNQTSGRDMLALRAGDRIIRAWENSAGAWSVEMGIPSFNATDVGLSRPVSNILDLGIQAGTVRGGVALSMGNPHVVFFFPRLDSVDFHAIASKISTDPLFSEGVNVGFAEVHSPQSITLKVWERGTGPTLACASGASAAVAAAHRLGLTGTTVEVYLPGGRLDVSINEHNVITQTGPATLVFHGFARLGSHPNESSPSV